MLQQSVKFPVDQLRVVFTIIATIPLSLVLYKLPSPTIRKYFSLILGVYLQYFIYGHQVWLSFGTHLIIYKIMEIKGRQCGFLVLWTSLVLLSFYHIYRMFIDYGGWKLDVSTIMMQNACKYSLFAFSYQDGGEKDQNLKTEDQKKQKIIDLPNFIDFLTYCLFLPTCIIGSPVNYHRYLMFMNQEQQFQKVPQRPCLAKLGKQSISTVIFFILHVFGHLYFPNSRMNEPDYPNKGFLYLLFYGFFSVFFTTQFKYVFAFSICMLPLHASGITYQPSAHKEDQFLGIKYMDFFTLITSLNPQTKINSWNMPVQQWLRKGVYERVNTSKRTAKVLTFLCSAFWHGCYGGYYLTFAFFFLELQLANAAYKFSKNVSHPLMKLYRQYEPISHYLVWIFITIPFYHNAQYFTVLCLSKGWTILKAQYFVSLIVILIPIAIFTLFKDGTHKQKKAKHN